MGDRKNSNKADHLSKPEEVFQNQKFPNDYSVNAALKSAALRRNYKIEVLFIKKINEEVVDVFKKTTMFRFIVDQIGTSSVINLEVINSTIRTNSARTTSRQKFLKNIEDVHQFLSLKIDKSGLIVDVLNKPELKKRWLLTKSKLKIDKEFNSLSTEDQNFIIRKGDFQYLEDFGFVDFLNSGYSLYAVMFLGYWQIYKNGETYKLGKRERNSMLFEDNDVPVEFEVNMKQNDSNTDTFELEIQGLEPIDYQPTTFRDLYKEKYSDKHKDFEPYSYEYLGTYYIQKKTGLIKKMNASIFEVFGNVEMFMDFNLKQITIVDYIKMKLQGIMNRLLFWWFSYRMIFISMLVLGVLLARVCLISVVDYATMTKLEARIAFVKTQSGKYTSVKIKLDNSENLYYQDYHGRFYDENAFDLQKGKLVTFYTTESQYHKPKPLLQASSDSNNFYYYPIFNVNSEKSFLSVFFYHFYKNSILNIILLISIVSTFFYSAPIVMTCGWKKRIILLMLAAMAFYLLY